MATLNVDNLEGFCPFNKNHTAFKKLFCFHFLTDGRNEYLMSYKKFTKHSHTLEFQMEGEGGINGEAGKFRPK